MLEHNRFDKNWNNVYANFFYDVTIYIYITILTLDEHINHFDNMILFKLNHIQRKTPQY